MPPAPPDPLSRAFGVAVREARESKGWTQDALAERADLQRTYVVEVERGRRNLTLRNIGRIAAALEMSIVDLMAIAERRTASGSR